MDFEVFCEKIWGNACEQGRRMPRHISPSVTAKGRDTSLTEGGKGNGFPRQCEHWLGMTGFFDSLTSLTEGGFGRGQAKYFSLKGMFSTVKVRPRR